MLLRAELARLALLLGLLLLDEVGGRVHVAWRDAQVIRGLMLLIVDARRDVLSVAVDDVKGVALAAKDVAGR